MRAVPSKPFMYRFLLHPRWLLFHLLCIGAVVLMIYLGFWQLRRLDERQAFNGAVAARIDLPAVPLEEALATASPDELEWRSVTARGEYLVDEQFVVVNRSQDGRAGDIVVTPLLLDDRQVLLVERGFVPFGLQASPAPVGTVDVVGRLRPSDERQRGQLGDPPDGDLTVAQRLDIDRLAGQLPGRPVDAYVELTSSEPAEIGPFPAALDEPELSEGSHLSYAGQWFIFAGGVIVGWYLAVRHSLKSRRAAAARAASRAPFGARAKEALAAPRSSPG